MAASDNYPQTVNSSARHAMVVTPSDSADLASSGTSIITREIHIGTAGDLAVIMAGGESLTIPSLTAGRHALMLTRIKSTGTTAANITAYW